MCRINHSTYYNFMTLCLLGPRCPSETAHWEHTVGLTCYIADSVVTAQCGKPAYATFSTN